MIEKQKLIKIVGSLAQRSSEYLIAETGIAAQPKPQTSGDMAFMQLRDMTSIIGIGGNVALLIAFSFDKSLAKALFEGITEGMHIAPEDIPVYYREVLGEVINIVVGNCDSEFDEFDDRISMSPPIIIEEVKTIQRMKESVFISESLETEFGFMDINIIGPKKLFDSNLNYAD